MKAHILMAEDLDSFRNSAAFALEQSGYRVTACANGQSAVDAFAKDPEDIDLVILDMVMPDMSGRQTWEEMKKLRKSFPLILASGYAISEETRDIVDFGAKILDKPFEADDLIELVAKILPPH